MKIDVSVIIPCYNADELIEETFRSLENQSYNNFEVVCINDGSTDNTLSKIKAFKKRALFPIKMIDKKNGGVSSARNVGIREAQGEYILFLDSDDLYHPEFVRNMYFTINNMGVDVAYCKLSRKYKDILSLTTVQEAVEHNQEIAMNRLLFEMGQYGFCCYIYKKSILTKEKIIFDENTKFGEDREFIWKYLCHCKSFAWIDSHLYWYRINKDSTTRREATWRKTDMLAAVKRTGLYLEENGCPYTQTYNDYMYPRSMWAVAKTFSLGQRKDLFKKLLNEYDVKENMLVTAKDRNRLVTIASWLFLIHPMLFYYTISGIKN
jgi:glycosyltransferase involved in cell wall biosynthesis